MASPHINGRRLAVTCDPTAFPCLQVYHADGNLIGTLSTSTRRCGAQAKSTSLRDQRRVHQTCIGELPEETRSSDLLKLKRWLGEAQELADPGADSIVAMLMASVAPLEGGGAPAPSGGVAPENENEANTLADMFP